MQSRLLAARETGELSQAKFARSITSEFLSSFAIASHHEFDGTSASESGLSSESDRAVPNTALAHRSGVQSIAIDKFNGKLMISGGAEGSIKIWDLESCGNPHHPYTFRPVKSIPKVREDSRRLGHTRGVTHLDFHPKNPNAFLSSSFDHSLKLWSCETGSVTAHFYLEARVYSHATSPIAGDVVVACATQHSNIRLVDLRSRSAAQSLPATGGAVLSVAWSPRHEKVLASGHADGRVRIWDARRTHGPIAQLDQEDSLGIVHRFNHAVASGLGWSKTPRFRASARAHSEAVNSLAWTDDGNYIVSAGLDNRIRVWDAVTGANTLAGFGAIVHNLHEFPLPMIVSPCRLTPSRGNFLFWPNETEILVLDLHEGHTIARLRASGTVFGGETGRRKSRITDMAWRGAGGRRRVLGGGMGGSNAPGGIYTAHADGHIRAWMPRLSSGEEEDPIDDGEDVDSDTRKRKRKVLDDAYRSLMGKQITFTDPA